MNMNTDTHAKEILTEVIGGLGVITLNRPQVLNALSLEMIESITEVLAEWENNEQIQAVFFHGAGQRSFCAGGDIKAVHNAGLKYKAGEAPEEAVTIFFAREYALNKILYHYSKLLISFMDGITMGGGFGVAGPCDYRIATKNTIFAMPETGIGFYPDVASVYSLHRAPGETGAYLDLTGNSIGPEDTVYCGLATHYVPDLDGKKIIQVLSENSNDIQDVIRDSLSSLSKDVNIEGQCVEKHRKIIDRCFAFDDVESILTALEKEDDVWAKETLDLIKSRSPTSLKVSLRHYRQAKGQSFDQIIAGDYELTRHFLKGHDFYEGVRAMVIDKDRQPQWSPKFLEDISDTDVDAYFMAHKVISKTA